MNRRMTSIAAVLRRHVLTLAVAVGVVLALAAGASGSIRTGQHAAGGAGASTLAGTWKPLPAAPVKNKLLWGYLVGVWTGQEMIIHDLTPVYGGGVTYTYGPASNTWTTLPNSPPSGTLRGEDHAVWTGSEMLVLGPPTLGAYNPATNTWRTIPFGGGGDNQGGGGGLDRSRGDRLGR